MVSHLRSHLISVNFGATYPTDDRFNFREAFQDSFNVQGLANSFVKGSAGQANRVDNQCTFVLFGQKLRTQEGKSRQPAQTHQAGSYAEIVHPDDSKKHGQGDDAANN